MTSETRTFINPKDIAGIEVECKCGVTIFYPISAAEQSTKILARCSHCNKDLFDATPVSESTPYPHFPSYPAIEDLNGIASRLNRLNSVRTDIKAANVRFRIDVEQRSK